MSQLRITPKFDGPGYIVELDGVDISQRLSGISIDVTGRSRKPTAVLIYACDSVTFAGDADEVIHVCPMETS